MKKMSSSLKAAADLHENVPPNWYYQSMKVNLGQRYWHSTRFKEVASLIEPVKGKILDIGCADGMFTKVILDKSNATEIVGIDALEGSIKWAKKHWKKESRLKFSVGNAHELNYKASTFDAVFALEVLEHVNEPLIVLKEIRRVLKKGGYAVFLVPTDSALFQGIWFLWTKFWRGRIWDDCHIQSYKNDRLVTLSKKAGFKVEKNHKFMFGCLQAIKVRKV